MTIEKVGNFKDLIGYDLGTHNIAFNERDAILYALACGAKANDLSLVYERDLRVLPTLACALGLWAVEKAGRIGTYDPKKSLHASQSLIMHAEVPRNAEFESRGRVSGVWDKGKATIVDIEVKSEFFTAVYSIFIPGVGGWGGENTPPRKEFNGGEVPQLEEGSTFQTSNEQAALYRLTGDLHPIHIDPVVAKSNGFDRPILHGLCTLGIACREVSERLGKHPADISSLNVRLSAPVLPGSKITNYLAERSGITYFESGVNELTVLKGGQMTHKSLTR